MFIPDDVAMPVETRVDSEEDRRFFPQYKTKSGLWENIRHRNRCYLPRHVYSSNWYFTQGQALACCTRFKHAIERIQP